MTVRLYVHAHVDDVVLVQGPCRTSASREAVIVEIISMGVRIRFLDNSSNAVHAIYTDGLVLKSCSHPFITVLDSGGG